MNAPVSPNWNERPDGAGSIRCLMLHYTGMRSGEEALARLCAPEAQVSAHYVVFEDGRIVQPVADAKRAWHAGVSCWQGRSDLNDVSIGVEIVNTGHAHGLRPFPARQMAAAVELCRDLVDRHRIEPAWIVGHSDVAPTRKLDPGERFDWRQLAAAGIGLYPEPTAPKRPDPLEAADLLRTIGYPLPEAAGLDRLVLAAFQRRYRPNRVDGRLDSVTMERITAVATLHRQPG